MFRFYRKKSIALLLTVCFLLTMVVPGFAAGTRNTGNSLQDARDGIVGYYLKNKTTLSSWREVAALNAAGQDVSNSPWTLPDWKVASLNDKSQPTDYAGKILGMLAAGQNPKDVGGRNLVDELAAMQDVNGGFGDTINQNIWAVIALDKADGSYDTEKAVGFILSQQKSDGGFAFSGEKSEPDMTGDALVALAQHKDVAGVSDSINSAIGCLKELQLPNGGFVSWGSEAPESAAAVIRGLLACGEKNITSGDWQKEKGNMIDSLFSFQLEDGSFIHSTSETKYNAMATEQALMAVADMANAGITYTVKTGQKHTGDETTEATVRVRVEGATESLADKTVTITGSAFDALQVAVGEENLVANGDAVFSIYGKYGTRIENGLYSGWMYYVIRDGAVDLDAFSLTTGAYEVKDGDEIVFYMAAYQTSPPYAVKTYLPDVKVSPAAPTAGQAVTLSISALQLNESWDGLEPIPNEEATAIGDFTVLAGGTTYTSQYGQVTIPNVPEGALNFTVTNSNEKGYADVITYKGKLDVRKAVDSTVRVRVEGAEGSLKDATVNVTGTALDALKAAVGEKNVEAPGGFINSILGESGKQISENISTDWMYYVIRNGEIEPGAFSQGAGSFNVKDGDQVVFYIGAAYSDGDTWAPKTFFPVVSINPQSPIAGQDITLTIKTMKNDWMAGLIELTAEELEAIGEYTVVVGDKKYVTQNGKVTIKAEQAGTLSFIITNQNEAGYPNVVPYKGEINVLAADEEGTPLPGDQKDKSGGTDQQEKTKGKTGLPRTGGNNLPLYLVGTALLFAGALTVRKKQHSHIERK